MGIFRQTHSRFLVGVAVLLFLAFCGTLTASLGGTLIPLPEESLPPPAFAHVAPRTPTVSCSCVSCDAHGKGGGTCCCAGADTSREALAYRAVCDTPLDAAINGSLLPPIALPQTETAPLPVVTPSVDVAPCAFVGKAPDDGSPLPPDAPPRFS